MIRFHIKSLRQQTRFSRLFTFTDKTELAFLAANNSPLYLVLTPTLNVLHSSMASEIFAANKTCQQRDI